MTIWDNTDAAWMMQRQYPQSLQGPGLQSYHTRSCCLYKQTTAAQCPNMRDQSSKHAIVQNSQTPRLKGWGLNNSYKNKLVRLKEILPAEMKRPYNILRIRPTHLNLTKKDKNKYLFAMQEWEWSYLWDKRETWANMWYAQQKNNNSRTTTRRTTSSPAAEQHLHVNVSWTGTELTLWSAEDRT